MKFADESVVAAFLFVNKEQYDSAKSLLREEHGLVPPIEYWSDEDRDSILVYEHPERQLDLDAYYRNYRGIGIYRVHFSRAPLEGHGDYLRFSYWLERMDQKDIEEDKMKETFINIARKTGGKIKIHGGGFREISLEELCS